MHSRHWRIDQIWLLAAEALVKSERVMEAMRAVDRGFFCLQRDVSSFCQRRNYFSLNNQESLEPLLRDELHCRWLTEMPRSL